MSFDFNNAEKPFISDEEITDIFSDILDLHIFYMYKYHSWVGPDNTLQGMLGVVVSREEFEGNLTRASDRRCKIQLSDEDRVESEKKLAYFLRRAALTKKGREFPIFSVAKAFSLDDFELLCLLTLYCCEIDRKYEKLFAYLQDDIARKTPTAETLIKLFGKPFDKVSDYYSYFAPESVFFRFIAISDGEGFGTAPLRLSPKITGFILGFSNRENFTEFKADEPLKAVDLGTDDFAADIEALRSLPKGKTLLAFFIGRKGCGKRFRVKRCAAALKKSVVFANTSEIFSEGEGGFYSALCESVLKGSLLCFTDFEYLLDDERADKLAEFTALLKQNAKWLKDRVFVTSEKKWNVSDLGDGIVKIDFEIPEIGESSRLELWRAFTESIEFSGDISLEETALKFRFNAGQIKKASELMRISQPVSSEILHKCCYCQVTAELDELASAIKPAYDFEGLVLPPSEIKVLKEACDRVRYAHRVYEEWGFGKRAVYGRGLSVLFSGPPGTGKTMAAQVVANQLHMKIYKVLIPQIVSKYIGETEKNLRNVFGRAREADCILFFDEMDALFGKRTDVKDSHDRNANIETAFLLQQLEEYDGVTLMATNLIGNIDEAFMRRINFVINFPFPDVPTRKRLWETMLDTKAPVDGNIDYDFLAENFKLAGGGIKNCAVHAAFLAAAENVPISMKHLISGVVAEQRKNNAVVLREDLKEYADLIFE